MEFKPSKTPFAILYRTDSSIAVADATGRPVAVFSRHNDQEVNTNVRLFIQSENMAEMLIYFRKSILDGELPKQDSPIALGLAKIHKSLGLKMEEN